MHLFATFVLLFPVLSESFARSTAEFNSGRPTSRPNLHPTSYTQLTTSTEPVRMTTEAAGDHTRPLFSITTEQVFEETSTETVTVNHVTTAPSPASELVCDSTNVSMALRKQNESVNSYTLTVCDLNATVDVVCLEFLCMAAADGLNSTKCNRTDTYLQTMYIRKSDTESCVVMNYTARGGNVLYGKCHKSEGSEWFLCSDETNSTEICTLFGQLCDIKDECDRTVIECTSDRLEDISEDCVTMNVSRSSSIDYMQNIEVVLRSSSFFISNLLPFTMYEFEVKSTHFNLTSSSVSCTTGESIPGMVGDLKLIREDIDSMTITWKEPGIKNGNLKYVIVLLGQDDEEIQKFSVNDQSYTFGNLIAGGFYTVQVAAATSVGQGEFSELSVHLPVEKPYLEFHNAIPRAQKISTDHFVVQLSNPFSNRNGKVIYYDLFIMHNSTAPNWERRAIKHCSSLFYSVNADHCWNKSLNTGVHSSGGVRTNTTVITVGGDKSCRMSSHMDEMDENCALEPSTTYYVFVRGYTAVDKHADGPFSLPIKTKEGELIHDQPSAALVVLIIILVMLTVFAAIIIFILYTRWQNPILQPLRDSRRVNQVAMNTLPSVTSKPVSAAEFTEHVNNLEKDSGLMFTEEFEELKYVGRDQQWEQAELQCNRAKNRFTNILPYDQTRVKLLPLEDVEGSDYINANWIPGFSSKREFIATQGPLPSTKDDFWRLVWEYNCRAVVMLTLCLENGRIKCDQYWPMDSEPLFYGDLQVKIMNETISSSWHIRELQISLGEQSRRIKHFHYLEWPDMKVPDQLSMLAFVQLVRSYVNSRSGGPVVVHCSAGVGRTGTFISLDVLLQQLEQDDVLDVYGIVYRMRMGRVLMVQTEQQYIFIYECMKHVLEKHTQQPHEHVKKEIVYENTNGTETASKSNSEDSNASESESDSSEPCEEQPYEQIQESLDDEGIEDANLC